MAKQKERTAGFAISVYDQRLIEDNARDKFDARYGDKQFREHVLADGLMNAKGDITDKGWEVLNDDIAKFERNALAWLKKNFISVRDEGHGSHDDLIGSLWWSPRSKRQRELLVLGEHDRIDGTDGSYGDFANTAFKGIGDFSATVLGGQINFFDTGLDSEGDDL